MPSNMLDTDVGFPKFTGRETTQDRIAMILNYLFMLREQLQYTLTHLGKENFNDASIVEIEKTITDPINARIEDEQGQITALQVTAGQLVSAIGDADGNISALQQTVNSLTLSVYTDNGISYVGLTKDGVTVYATGTIDMTGLVTFTDLSGSGTTVINGDNIVSGTITGTTLISEDHDYPGWLTVDNPSVKVEYGRITLGDSLKSLSGTQYGAIYAVHNGGDYGIRIDGYTDVYLNGNIYINGVLQFPA